MNARFAAFFFALFLLPLQGLESAAQNKVIARRFKWRVAQSEHFNIYYYQGAEKLLPTVSRSLEKAYQRVVPPLDVTIKGRSSFFLYLNHNEFEQNNIVDVGEGTGGVTEAFKDRFLVFNDGTQEWLDHVVAHEFVHVAQFSALYGGFWKSVRLLKSVLYPLWFMEGMAEYFSGENDIPQREMVVRDAITSKTFLPLTELHGFNHVKPHQVTLAYKTGETVLEFIAMEYGEDKIGLLLEAISEKFDMSGALQDILGVSVSDLSDKHKEWLEEKYEEEVEVRGLREPETWGKPFTAPDRIYPVFNSNPVFFPDGKRLAYLSDQQGFTELYVYDFSLGKSEPLRIQKRFPSKVENIHRSGSALSISLDGRKILFAGEQKQKDYLYIYDARRDRLKRLDVGLDGAQSPQYSPDGKTILFTGMKDGLNDLYLCDSDGRHMRRLTDTFADENHGRFLPNGKAVVFSREAPADKEGHSYRRDLWLLDLASGKESRLTELSGNAVQPTISPDGKTLVFVDDSDGINNLYRMALPAGKPSQITRVIGGNFFPTFSPNGEDLAFVSHRKGEQHLYLGSWGAWNPAPPPKKKGDSEIVIKQVPETVVASTSTALRGGRPYRIKGGTDFFFPVMFYSSTDGLFLSAYWQASEMLGNHQIQSAVTYASAFNFLNYQVFYSYLRFRPQFTFGFIGDTRENVFVTTRESRREDSQFVLVSYPLTRFDKISARMLTTQRRIQFEDDQFVTSRLAGRENVASMIFQRDVSQGRYLETTSGYRVEAQYDDSNDGLGSSLDYRDAFLTLHLFQPMHSESSFAFRAFGGAGFGSDRQFFRTGGQDLLRGYGRFDTNAAASRFVITNLEYRFPLALNTNFHIWFFFPDFIFKNVYGAVFMDNGVLWNQPEELSRYQWQTVRNSFGLSLRLQAFVLQTFPVSLQLDWARRTLDGEQVFYFGFGPKF